MKIDDIKSIYQKILKEIQKVVVGKQDILENLFIALLSEGHVLLEGVPGIAKTVMIKTFSRTLGCDFKRIQFTPDLLPADITGTYIYRAHTSDFVLRKGPIFTNILLADEINRAPPKTQAALLESMQERQVTIEGNTYQMPNPSIVMATQNPIEQEGTYPLPEAQVDRFQMRLLVEYPTRSEEKQILRLFNKKYNEDQEDILAVTDPTSIIDMQHKAKEIFVEEDIIDYITDIVFYTRENANVLLGGSPRASIALLKTSKVKAMIHGRDYVIPDDIKELTPHILNHRVILTPEAELEGLKPLNIINEALETVWI